MVETTTVKMKSLERYLEDQFEKFTYEDFQPSIDVDALKCRLREVLAHESPYWEKCDLPPAWQQNWIALRLKTHANIDSVVVGITVKRKSVHMNVFDGIHGTHFDHEFCEVDIEFKDIWKDHSTFLGALLKLIRKGQGYMESGAKSDFDWRS